MYLFHKSNCRFGEKKKKRPSNLLDPSNFNFFIKEYVFFSRMKMKEKEEGLNPQPHTLHKSPHLHHNLFSLIKLHKASTLSFGPYPPTKVLPKIILPRVFLPVARHNPSFLPSSTNQSASTHHTLKKLSQIFLS